MQSLLESVWERHEVSEGLTCAQSENLSDLLDPLMDQPINRIVYFLARPAEP